MPCIYVLDDEESMLQVVQRALEKDETYEVRAFSSPQVAVNEMIKRVPDIIITDIKMENVDGFQILRIAKKMDPDLNVILITAYASVDTAVQALRNGAFDYLIKPFKIEDLRLAVKRALSEKKIFGDDAQKRLGKRRIIGDSPEIKKVLAVIEKVSSAESTVLITGESGTGKELVARAVHVQSPRGNKPFVSINCAALPDGLLESELFGHEKGSFTGAIGAKIGLIEYAHTGSLFLDEIGDISPAIQVKLLRVLQEKEIKRVGGVQDIPVDVRIITATSKILEHEVKKGAFREDLFYRLNIIPIFIPALRERKQDIDLLIDFFTLSYNEKNKKQFTFDDTARTALREFDWPGNVRQLENVIERILTLAETDVINVAVVREICGMALFAERDSRQAFSSTLKRESSFLGKEMIMRILNETGGKKTEAAKRLNISKQNLQYYIKKYGL